jgi:hypothetical protein
METTYGAWENVPAQQSSGWDAWTMARLGNALDVLVDRELNSPQRMTANTGYGIDEYGNVYQLGQTGMPYAPTAPKPINWPFLLLVCGGLYMLTKD